MSAQAGAVAAGARRGPTAHRRLVAAIALAAYAVAVAAVLVSPVSPESLVAAVTAWLRDDVGLAAVRQGWVEVGANVALFAPLGALVTLAIRRIWIGVVAALVLSAAAELVQVLLPGRMASGRDVLANVLGAAIGAVAAAIVVAMGAAKARRKAGRS